MLDQFPLVGFPNGAQQALRIGRVAQQMERFFQALKFRKRQHHDRLPALSRDHEWCPALADAVQVLLQILAKLGIRDITHITLPFVQKIVPSGRSSRPCSPFQAAASWRGSQIAVCAMRATGVLRLASTNTSTSTKRWPLRS